MIKDGEFFLPRFLDHYRNLGIRQFVFIDNGSSDSTIRLILDQEDCFLFSTGLPVIHYQSLIRQEAIRRFGHSGWHLIVDVDELFDFPHRENVGLSGLVDYLEAHDFNALVAQMLDMFSFRNSSAIGVPSSAFDLSHTAFTLRDITEYRYHSAEIPFNYFLRGNRIGDDRIHFLFGGARKSLFGLMPCLTKHPLIKCNGDARPATHPHCGSNLRCADVSGLLKHYKFAGDYEARAQKEIDSGSRWAGEIERIVGDSARTDLLSLVPAFDEFSGCAELVSKGFLVSSSRFDAWVRPYSEKQKRR